MAGHDVIERLSRFSARQVLARTEFEQDGANRPGHGPMPVGHGMLRLIADVNLHRRFGHRRTAIGPKDNDAIMIEFEELLIAADLAAEHELKTGFGGLELIAGVFQVLYFFQDLA